MENLKRLSLGLALVCALTTAESVQFYKTANQYGAALATRAAANGTDVLLHLEAPTTYQWAAIGTGDRMDKSFMIIMQPAGVSSVHITTRSSHNHDAPQEINAVVEIVDSELQDARMSVDVKFSTSAVSNFQSIDPSSSKQAWIWAVGPRVEASSSSSAGDSGKRDGGSGELEQHSSYGVFFADMTKASQTSTSAPALSGTSNIAVAEPGGSYKALVVLHALLLGVAFVIVFPVGVICLRTRWKVAFGLHWLLQLLASGASFVGLALAIALSIIGVEYNDFNESHQVLGFIVIALLSAQIFAGIWHHRKWKQTRQRSAITYSHMLLGRILIYGGMVNAILGCLLADDNLIAYIVAAVSFILACILEYMSFRQQKTTAPKHNLHLHPSFSDVPLQSTSYDESRTNR